MNLNQLAAEIHRDNRNWWIDLETGEPLERNKGELLMLVVTELAEAVQGLRKDLMDDHLPHRKMEEVEMADAKIRLLDFCGGFGIKLHSGEISYELEIDFMLIGNKSEQLLVLCGDVFNVYQTQYFGNPIKNSIENAIAGIDLYCRIHNLDLEGAITEKRAYNKTRSDHQVEQRKLQGGKKF